MVGRILGMPDNDLSSYLVVIFCDILGDTTKHLDLVQHKDARERIVRNWKSTKDQIMNHKWDQVGAFQKWSFSDSFVFAYASPYPAGLTDRCMMTQSAILGVAGMSLKLMSKGVFVRGGFSQGTGFLDDENIIGPALLDAYLIEQKVAVSPCILLSKRSELFVRERKNNKAFVRQIGDVIVVRASDQRMIINPFAYSIRTRAEMGVDISVSKQYKKLIRDHIRANLNRHEMDVRVYGKYTFLRDLWNSSIEEDSNYKLTVPMSECPEKFQTLSELIHTSHTKTH